MMAVDDHVVDSLRRYFDDAYEELKKEWKSSEYQKLSDCPSFKTAYTYREALEILQNGPESFENGRLKRMIDEDMELESFWKNKKEQA